jgi:diguanylate cyclase (GGDEF)-like protein/PAS domain S-box-containing protein
MADSDIITRLDTSSLARMLDELPDIVVVLDASANLIWANHRAEQFFGRPLDVSIGLSGLDFVHPDDLELVLCSLETIQSKEIGAFIEIRVRSGLEWRLVELVGHPISWFSQGAILFSFRDLTARRRFEVAQNDDARFRSLYHNSTSIVLLVSSDGCIESVSGALTRMLGHDPELVEHRPLSELVAEADRPALGEALDRAIAGATASHPVTVAVNLVHRGSSDVTAFELSIVNLIEDPTVCGLVVEAHDVSARVAAESELKDALDEQRATLSLLSATLDSTSNGLLVVGADRTITSFNRQFAEMWQLPESILKSKDDAKSMAFVLDQLVDPVAFVARIDELYAHPDSESTDTIFFKDGRIFERSSKPQHLGGKAVGRVWSFFDVTDHKRLENELAHMAFHDSLTGLANRPLFRDRLEQSIARSNRTGKLVAVLYMDLDDFKAINDTMGHSAGDTLLIQVARRLETCLRPSDTAARLGGDEFAVLMEDFDGREGVMEFANRIIDELRHPIEVAAQKLLVTASIGVTYASRDAASDELLGNADLAMYTAKLRGKNRVVEFQPQMYTAVLSRLELESDLRRAIGAHEIEAHFQPIVDLRTLSIVGFEALARWRHPSKGLLPPSEFIDFAEEVGLIDSIDQAILVQACRHARSWQTDGLAPADLLISVNLSAREVVDSQIEDAITQTVQQSGFDPGNLILEITESAVMQDVDAAVRNLAALSTHGIRIAIDDFGTGYSSLSHLERLPVDILKIDRSFLARMSASDDAADLARAIVQLAQTFGVTPIAEGVESEGQVVRLRQMGCHLAQGFHLGIPLDARATRKLLASAQSDTQLVGVGLPDPEFAVPVGREEVVRSG